MPGPKRNHNGERDRLPPWGPAQTRDLRQRLRDPFVWDLVVVGAGITGAGIARDAALRGLRVLVLDAGDVARGTSSRSTRLIHGGVRYLEHAELGLVFESLRERAWLLEAAPHVVARRRFLFPVYSGDRLGRWALRLGLTLYDTLDGYRSRVHAALNAAECLEHEPLLSGERLQGALAYDDAVTDDARLTLLVLQDARRHGAEVLTYTGVERIDRSGDLHRIGLGVDGEVVARQAVVATGPWTSARLLGQAGAHVLTHSKGIHVVMRAEDVPVREPLVIQAQTEKRILFAVPWGARTYLGTTDDPFEGDPGDVGVTAAEEREVLDAFARVLPRAELTPDRIVSAWAGVRPLVRPARSREDTAEVSRRHRILETEAGVLGIVGGKLTTFRAMASELVDRVVARSRKLWPERARSWTTPATREGLVPGPPLSLAELRDPLIADLSPRYGSLARDLAASGSGAERLVSDLPYRWCEVDQAIHHEGATHLDDILRRRLPLALTDPALGGHVAYAVAERLVDAWGGSQADIDDELERYVESTHRETRRRPVIDRPPTRTGGPPNRSRG